MDTNEKPEIILEFQHLFCGLHGDPFRANWPAGTGIALAHACGLLSSNKDVMMLCQVTDKTIHLLPKRLQRQPFCCRISTEHLIGLYIESLGPLYGFKRCEECGNEDVYGSPFVYRDPYGILRRYDHFCFACLCCNMHAHKGAMN